MQYRILCFLWMTLYMTHPGVAQQNEVAKTTKQKREFASLPKATLKLNIPCLIDPLRSSLYFSSDIFLAKRHAVEVGAGYFFGSWDTYGREAIKSENLTGLRARLGYKYYYISYKYVAAYVGVEAKYNYIENKSYEELCRYGCQYTEWLLIKTTSHTAGVSIKTGLQVFLGREKRFFFEPYLGLGYRYLNRWSLYPEDAENLERQNGFGILRRPGIYHSPDFLLGVNFGYAFR